MEPQRTPETRSYRSQTLCSLPGQRVYPGERAPPAFFGGQSTSCTLVSTQSQPGTAFSRGTVSTGKVSTGGQSQRGQSTLNGCSEVNRGQSTLNGCLIFWFLEMQRVLGRKSTLKKAGGAVTEGDGTSGRPHLHRLIRFCGLCFGGDRQFAGSWSSRTVPARYGMSGNTRFTSL